MNHAYESDKKKRSLGFSHLQNYDSLSMNASCLMQRQMETYLFSTFKLVVYRTTIVPLP